MDRVKNKKTGEVGLADFNEFYGGVVVYALPKHDFEIKGRLIARYKTRKGFWKSWEIWDTKGVRSVQK